MYPTELLKGTLSTIILRLLADHGKMYGYEIAQKVKELSHEKILIKEGSLYPTLHKLLDERLVGVEEVYIGKRIRKYYFLTEHGHSVKQVRFDELRSFLSTIEKLVFTQIVSTG